MEMAALQRPAAVSEAQTLLTGILWTGGEFEAALLTPIYRWGNVDDSMAPVPQAAADSAQMPHFEYDVVQDATVTVTGVMPQECI